MNSSPTNWKDLSKVGFSQQEPRAGTYILQNSQPVYQSSTDGLEVLPIGLALYRYSWLKKYFYSLIKKETIKGPYPNHLDGYFIHVEKDREIPFLCQTALLMETSYFTQAPHNVILLDEGAELTLLTGCLSATGIETGTHSSITERYIGKGALLHEHMVHRWGNELMVTSHSGTMVEEGGTYISDYIGLKMSNHVLSYPETWLNGANATTKYRTIILDNGHATIELGGTIHLDADDTSAELAHRAICTGGQIYQKGILEGNARCKAHIDCAGMLLGNSIGIIESVPGLRSHHPDARLSHEASIGKISPQQVEYLRSRGIDKADAISMIVRGFLDLQIEGLGSEIDRFIKEMVELAGHGEGN